MDKYWYELKKPLISGVWKERFSFFLQNLIGIAILYLLMKIFK